MRLLLRRSQNHAIRRECGAKDNSRFRAGNTAQPRDEAMKHSASCPDCTGALRNLPRNAGRGLIWIYRHSLSPLIGFHCRHVPTCSAYGDEAIARSRVISTEAYRVTVDLTGREVAEPERRLLEEIVEKAKDGGYTDEDKAQDVAIVREIARKEGIAMSISGDSGAGTNAPTVAPPSTPDP